MAIGHIAVLSAALSALLLLPCAATLLLSDNASGLRRFLTRVGREELRAQHHRDHTATRHPARRRADRAPRGRDGHDWRRLDRSLCGWDQTLRLSALRSPPIEQIAYDLRRLDRQRRTGPAVQSEAWLSAVMRGYDTRLAIACRCLDIPEHLEALTGLERDLERVRVEGLLAAAGLILRHETGPSA